MLDKDNIVRKINALLAKTTSRGCTEAEAMEAATKAAELMTRYNISEGAIGFSKGECQTLKVDLVKWGKGFIGKGFLGAIGSLCDCKILASASHVLFFGFKSDILIAEYLYKMLSNTILSESEIYKSSPQYHTAKARGFHGKTITFSFIAGMESRLAQRLRELASSKNAATNASSTSLVVVKMNKVVEEFSKEFPTVKMMSQKRTIKSHSGYQDGQKKGEEVRITTALAHA